MCFSPEVDALAGLLIGAVGIDAVRHVRTPAERPLAVLPLLFAGHQLVEAFVWWGLEGKVATEVGHAAEWLYLAIAFGVLPILVPIAVGALEPVAHRRRTSAFVALGTFVAVILMYGVVRGPLEARIRGHYVAYDVDLWHGGALTVLYVVATCGALLISDRRHVRAWGVANLAAVLVLAWVNQAGLISLWCVWAAVTSVAIATHLRHAPTLSRDVASPVPPRAW
ncbi:DUF6629 family protein [Nocardioides sp. LS1]|uniref:DUF6629 family protein n=1 Tax=Nocardioides sp. LS1 TaxID=1027620 RepID=UPI000FFA65C2|nr:DUF6629 family protein [Nocardioides sp. LS1]GCD88562.1 hypothetical protein NLS1_05680 [Nocardioides sp. LS1]